MRNLVVFTLLILILSSCSNSIKHKEKVHLISDTVVGKKNEITDANQKKASSYFVVVKKDTSKFTPVFATLKNTDSVHINLNRSYYNKAESYFKRLEDFKLILPHAAKDFDLSLLNNLFIGRFILSGDLAIIVTEEYQSKYGENTDVAISDYNKIESFLLESRLSKDLNELFKPYSKSVSKIHVEKVFFTDKKEVFRYSDVLRDSLQTPDKLLDFVAWIELNDI